MLPPVKLVPFSASHFATLAGWFDSEAEVVQWAGPGLSYPLDPLQLAAIVAEGEADPPRRLAWMAEAGDEWVGHAQLWIDWPNGNAVLSRVAVAPAARGRGLAAPMLRQVVDRAFELAAIERLELNVYSFNEPARRTYQRLGFVTEGVRRASTRVGHERWDTVIMAQLRPEWENIRT